MTPSTIPVDVVPLKRAAAAPLDAPAIAKLLKGRRKFNQKLNTVISKITNQMSRPNLTRYSRSQVNEQCTQEPIDIR